MKNLLRLIVIFISIIHFVVGEYFTSVSHMKALFSLERQLTLTLDKTIAQQKRQLKELEKLEKIISLAHIDNDPETYLSSPINSYLLIKRFVKTWPQIRKSLESSEGRTRELITVLDEHSAEFPTNEDVAGAREALIRLQETFLLQPEEFVSGLGMASKDSQLLETDDTYDIAIQAYEKNKKELSHGWFSQALLLLDNNKNQIENGPTRFDILDHIAWIEYLTSDYEAAYNHTLEMFRLQPSNERIRTNLIAYNQTRKRQKKILESRTTPSPSANDKSQEKKYKKFYFDKDESNIDRYPIEIKRMQQLCRGETDPIRKRDRRKLICWMKNDHPLLKIRPAFVERVFVKPEILLFRGVLADRDINRVKELAHPYLERATVHNPATGKLEFADYRTSKSAWLDEEDDYVVLSMNKRLEAYTGLSLETAEKLQVANYGIGGHYEVHFDFARTVKLRPPPWKNRTDYIYRVRSEEPQLIQSAGNRIATFLLYMSDVVRGGSTVFTNIGQAVKPSKGDAVFWYNLHHDGSGDPDTRHAACPVLIGEKWVSNRWIHERGQEFRRQCRLRPEDD